MRYCSRFPVAVFVLVAAAAVNVQSFAEVLAFDQFLYPPPGNVLGGRDGGAGWAGPWSGDHLLSTAGLETEYNSFPLPGGEPATTAAVPRGGYAYSPCESQSSLYGRVSIRELVAPIDLAQDGTYYFSVLLRRNSTETDCSGWHPAYNNLRAAFAFLAGGSHPVNDAEILIGTNLQFAGGSDTLEAILRGTPEPGTEAADDTILNNTTFLIVGKIVARQSGYDQLLFERYRPGKTIDAFEPEWDKYSRPALNSATLDRVCIFGEAALAVDELRIGTTWASVTSEVLPVVCEVEPLPDFDENCCVDARDFVNFEACFSGPAAAQVAAGCAPALIDGDNDVDLLDFARFQALCR